MKDLQKALHDFWAGFSIGNQSIPAYPSGQVEDGAAFPYIVYETIQGSCYSQNVLTAILWLQQRNGTSVNADRQQFFQSVRSAIPESGTLIKHDYGAVMIFREPQNFLSIYNDTEPVNGLPVYGGRVSYGIEYLNE